MYSRTALSILALAVVRLVGAAEDSFGDALDVGARSHHRGLEARVGGLQADGRAIEAIDSWCRWEPECPSIFAVGETGIGSAVVASSRFESDGNITLSMAVATTGSSSWMTGTLKVTVDCLEFVLAVDECEIFDDDAGCVLRTTVSTTLDPSALVGTLCPDHVTTDGGVVNLTLGVTVDVGQYWKTTMDMLSIHRMVFP